MPPPVVNLLIPRYFSGALSRDTRGAAGKCIGDTYNDLGATIVAPDADKNLGIKTFLNGKLVSNIVIDTTQVATDTIDYVVTDPAGLTATSTRTVLIEPRPGTAPPSSDTATSTPATSTPNTAPMATSTPLTVASTTAQ